MKNQLKKTLKYEAKIVRKMTRCFACSDTDKSYLMNMSGEKNITTIPNGVDIDYLVTNPILIFQ